MTLIQELKAKADAAKAKYSAARESEWAATRETEAELRAASDAAWEAWRKAAAKAYGLRNNSE